MNIKWFVAGFACFVWASFGAVAQDKVVDTKPQILINLNQDDGMGGHVEIVQPPQVEMLLNMQIANNRLQKGIPGYRIRIFSQSGQTARQRAEDMRREFMKHFPEMEAHWGYNTPNFQIFVGDFRTKNEALSEKKVIEKLFPGAFIVSEIIRIPK